jgi:hypothetical protein
VVLQSPLRSESEDSLREDPDGTGDVCEGLERSPRHGRFMDRPIRVPPVRCTTVLRRHTIRNEISLRASQGERTLELTARHSVQRARGMPGRAATVLFCLTMVSPPLLRAGKFADTAMRASIAIRVCRKEGLVFP